MKAKWTVKDIMDFDPCYSEKKVQELFGSKKFVSVSDICKTNIPHRDFFWLVLRPEFIPEKQLHEIAIWCAERIAMPIWEKYYPDDKRPQNAIQVKKAWLKGKATIEELAAARDAAWAAAGDAEDAAWAAAWAATRDAEDAANIKKHIIKVMLKKK